MTNLNKSVPKPLNTAVLFLVFNRPVTTARVFEVIRQVQPPRLYVAADGPRKQRKDEFEKTNEVRKIATNVDWPCEVKTLFREDNLGCRHAVSNAITWFFETEEQGIILEDDCLPSRSFFWFCEELLGRYRNNPQVGIISGTNYFNSQVSLINDYYFSSYPFIWGWATWKTVWCNYSVNNIPNDREKVSKVLKNLTIKREAFNYWRREFLNTASNRIDSWDYQLTYMIISRNLLNIIPAVNLISNIGHGPNATHTIDIENEHSNMERHEIAFPLKHVQKIERNKNLDELFEIQSFCKQSLFKRLYNLIHYYFF